MKNASPPYRPGAGPGRIPWLAVGEQVAHQDLLEVVRFLLPSPAGGDTPAYQAALDQVRQALIGLAPVAGHAASLTLGANVQALEQQCRDLLGVRHALFLTNATAGFEIALQLAGLRPGDEVIVPAITFVSTMAYPLTLGAKVVFADVDPITLNLDPADLARKITPKTRAVLPVHLGGYPCDMDAILAVAKRHQVVVIEDAAHAFGGRYHGQPLGTLGDFGAYSFHQVKNFTSFGEGGLLVSNLDAAAQFPLCRFLGIDYSRHAAGWIYDVTAPRTLRDGCVMPGNHSATELQAIGLRCQLARFAGILAQRRQAAAYLTHRLQDIPGILPQPLDRDGLEGTYMMYLLQVDPGILGADIQALKRKLAERGVAQIPHFVPLYHYSAIRQLGYPADDLPASCPVAEEAYRHRFTHLPLANLSQADLDYLADAVIDAARELRAGH